MPIKVADLETNSIESYNSTRKKILLFLEKNHDLAYTLKELLQHFLNNDKELNKKHKANPKVLYNLIYGYLRNYESQGSIVHKGNYYYLNQKFKTKKKT